jgi:hypothetical protein
MRSAIGLGTDIPLTQHIVVVAADGQNLLAIVLDFDSAHGFTEMAGSVVKLAHGIIPLFWLAQLVVMPD